MRYLVRVQTTQTYPAFGQKSFLRVRKKNKTKRFLNSKKRKNSVFKTQIAEFVKKKKKQ